MPSDERERRLDALYSAELERFVELRDRWGREVAGVEGKEAAEAIRRLTKPTVPAWVVNRIALERPLEMDTLLDAGERLREAQQSGEVAALHRAQEERRQRLERLLELAQELLAGSGRAASTATLERVRRTLETIAVYGRTGRLPTPPGRLTRELEPPGFEVLATLAALPARPKGNRGTTAERSGEKRVARAGAAAPSRRVAAPTPAQRGERERTLRRAREKAEKARAAEAGALERLQAVEAERRQGERELAAARQQVERLERLVDRHRARERELETELERARERRRQAEAALTD